ncbi:hypothetical protein WJ972_03045 [Achromobacter insuavis]
MRRCAMVGVPPAALPGDAAAGLQDAISALRGALESRMDGLLWGGRQGPGREPAGAALFRSLLDAGFSTKLVRALVERMPQGMSAESALAWTAMNWSRTCRCWGRKMNSWAAACTRWSVRPASARPPRWPSWRRAASRAKAVSRWRC